MRRLGLARRTSIAGILHDQRVDRVHASHRRATRGIVGQQVSVRAATTMLGRIAATFGESLGEPVGEARGEVSRLFPSAAALAEANLERIGLTRARSATIRALGDFGALGFVSDYLVGRYETPDALSWMTTCTEGDHWHVQASDRPRIGFSITPRTGDKLRTALRKGPVLVHVASDGKLYEGELDIVTGVIPGEDKRELWLIRDRIGVKPLCYSVHDGRIVFASEMKTLLQDPGRRREVDGEAL